MEGFRGARLRQVCLVYCPSRVRAKSLLVHMTPFLGICDQNLGSLDYTGCFAQLEFRNHYIYSSSTEKMFKLYKL